MGSLAGSYYEAGRKEEALKLREETLPLCHKALCKELLALRRKVCGPEDPGMLEAMLHLANCYRKNSDVANVEALGKEIAALKAKAHAPLPASK